MKQVSLIFDKIKNLARHFPFAVKGILNLSNLSIHEEAVEKQAVRAVEETLAQ